MPSQSAPEPQTKTHEQKITKQQFLLKPICLIAQKNLTKKKAQK
jgi:hypothetical protein